MWKLKRNEFESPSASRQWEAINPKLSMVGLTLIPMLKSVVRNLDKLFKDFQCDVQVAMHAHCYLYAFPPKCATHRCKFACAMVAGDLLPFLCENEVCSAKALEAMDIFQPMRAYKNFIEELIKHEESYRVHVGVLLFEISELLNGEQYDFLQDIGVSYTFRCAELHQPWPVSNCVKAAPVHELVKDMRDINNFAFSIATDE
ncbi:hypothetical protein KM043_000001, partial [Ampulex compressa]